MAITSQWPDSLPAPRIDGYSRKDTPSFVRTTMDSGASRQRRRFVTTPKTFQQAYRMTQAQLEIFEIWFENQAFGGAAQVLMPVITGAGKSYVQCKFTDTPSIAGVSGSKLWDVTVTLETLVRFVPNG